MTNKEEILLERIRTLHARIAHLCLEKGKGLDTTKMIHIYAGVVVELLLEYELPGDMMREFTDRISLFLDVKHSDEFSDYLPAIDVLDKEIEFGRSFAREITLEEWDDVHSCITMLSDLIIHDFSIWQEHGVSRRDSYYLLSSCIRLGLAFELSAQDMCDMLIEDKVGGEKWTLGDCVVALSGLAGWQYAEDHNGNMNDDNLDRVIFIMTQEAMRLGVPNNPCWFDGMPANDVPPNPPIDLVESAGSLLLKYVNFIQITDCDHVAAMFAKAAGRMLAVASGDDFPEIEPAIAKPIAMRAITESYHSKTDQQIENKRIP